MQDASSFFGAPPAPQPTPHHQQPPAATAASYGGIGGTAEDLFGSGPPQQPPPIPQQQPPPVQQQMPPTGPYGSAPPMTTAASATPSRAAAALTMSRYAPTPFQQQQPPAQQQPQPSSGAPPPSFQPGGGPTHSGTDSYVGGYGPPPAASTGNHHPSSGRGGGAPATTTRTATPFVAPPSSASQPRQPTAAAPPPPRTTQPFAQQQPQRTEDSSASSLFEDDDGDGGGGVALTTAVNVFSNAASALFSATKSTAAGASAVASTAGRVAERAAQQSVAMRESITSVVAPTDYGQGERGGGGRRLPPAALGEEEEEDAAGLFGGPPPPAQPPAAAPAGMDTIAGHRPPAAPKQAPAQPQQKQERRPSAAEELFGEAPAQHPPALQQKHERRPSAAEELFGRSSPAEELFGSASATSTGTDFVAPQRQPEPMTAAPPAAATTVPSSAEELFGSGGGAAAVTTQPSAAEGGAPALAQPSAGGASSTTSSAAANELFGSGDPTQQHQQTQNAPQPAPSSSAEVLFGGGVAQPPQPQPFQPQPFQPQPQQFQTQQFQPQTQPSQPTAAPASSADQLFGGGGVAQQPQQFQPQPQPQPQQSQPQPQPGAPASSAAELFGGSGGGTSGTDAFSVNPTLDLTTNGPNAFSVNPTSALTTNAPPAAPTTTTTTTTATAAAVPPTATATGTTTTAPSTAATAAAPTTAPSTTTSSRPTRVHHARLTPRPLNLPLPLPQPRKKKVLPLPPPSKKRIGDGAGGAGGGSAGGGSLGSSGGGGKGGASAASTGRFRVPPPVTQIHTPRDRTATRATVATPRSAPPPVSTGAGSQMATTSSVGAAEEQSKRVATTAASAVAATPLERGAEEEKTTPSPLSSSWGQTTPDAPAQQQPPQQPPTRTTQPKEGPAPSSSTSTTPHPPIEAVATFTPQQRAVSAPPAATVAVRSTPTAAATTAEATTQQVATSIVHKAVLSVVDRMIDSTALPTTHPHPQPAAPLSPSSEAAEASAGDLRAIEDRSLTALPPPSSPRPRAATHPARAPIAANAPPLSPVASTHKPSAAAAGMLRGAEDAHRGPPPIVPSPDSPIGPHHTRARTSSSVNYLDDDSKPTTARLATTATGIMVGDGSIVPVAVPPVPSMDDDECEVEVAPVVETVLGEELAEATQQQHQHQQQQQHRQQSHAPPVPVVPPPPPRQETVPTQMIEEATADGEEDVAADAAAASFVAAAAAPPPVVAPPPPPTERTVEELEGPAATAAAAAAGVEVEGGAPVAEEPGPAAADDMEGSTAAPELGGPYHPPFSRSGSLMERGDAGESYAEERRRERAPSIVVEEEEERSHGHPDSAPVPPPPAAAASVPDASIAAAAPGGGAAVGRAATTQDVSIDDDDNAAALSHLTDFDVRSDYQSTLTEDDVPPMRPSREDLLAEEGLEGSIEEEAVGAAQQPAAQREEAPVPPPPPPPPSERPQALPPGWTEYADPSSGRPYYVHVRDGSTTWDRPSSSHPFPASSAEEQEGVPTTQRTTEQPQEGASFAAAAEARAYAIVQGAAEKEKEEEEKAAGVVASPPEEGDVAGHDYDAAMSHLTDFDVRSDYQSTLLESDVPPSPRAEEEELAEDEDEKFDEEKEEEYKRDEEEEEEAERTMPSESSTPPLPAGWIELLDPSSNAPYYLNEVTQETTWDRPTTPTTTVPSSWDRPTTPTTVPSSEAPPAAVVEEEEDIVCPTTVAPVPQPAVAYSVRVEEEGEEDATAAAEQPEPQQPAPLAPPLGVERTAIGTGTGGGFGEEEASSLTAAPPSEEQRRREDADEDAVPPATAAGADAVDDELGAQEVLAAATTTDDGPLPVLLPPGWIELIDPSSGRPYYLREATNETTWDKPETNTAAVDSHPAVVAVDNAEEKEGERTQQVELDAVGGDDAIVAEAMEEVVAAVEGGPNAPVVVGLDSEMIMEGGTPATEGDAFASSAFEEKVEEEEEQSVEGGAASAAAAAAASSAEATAAATEEQDEDASSSLLPPGWVELVDPDSGAPYYLNEATNETTWDKPATVPPPPTVGAAEEQESPSSSSSPERHRRVEAPPPDGPDEPQQPPALDEVEEEVDVVQEQEEEEPSSSYAPMGHEEAPEGGPVGEPEVDAAAAAAAVAAGPASLESAAEGDHHGISSDEVVAPTPLLPAGWVELFDETSGLPYYLNEATDETTWDRPAAAPSSSSGVVGGDDDEAAGVTRGVGAEEEIPRSVSTEEDEMLEEKVEEEREAKAPLASDGVEGGVAAAEPVEPRPTAHAAEDGSLSAAKDDGGVVAPMPTDVPKEKGDEPTTLPPGWVELFDEGSGLPYYLNEGTNETTWDRPQAAYVVEEEREGGEAEQVAPPTRMDERPADQEENLDSITGGGEEEDAGIAFDRGGQEPPVRLEDTDVPTTEDADGEAAEEALDRAADEDGESTTDRPIIPEETQGVDVDDAVAETTAPGLPPGWIELVDPSTGMPYYLHEGTNETTWDRPAVDVKGGIEGGDGAEAAPTTTPMDETPDQKVEEEKDQSNGPRSADERYAVDDGPESSRQDDGSTSGTDGALAMDSGGAAPGAPEDDWAEQEGYDVVAAPEQQKEMEEEENEPPAVASSELPPGWVELVDPSSGTPYYLNEATNETTWDKPALPVVEESGGDRAEASPSTREDASGAAAEVERDARPAASSEIPERGVESESDVDGVRDSTEAAPKDDLAEEEDYHVVTAPETEVDDVGESSSPSSGLPPGWVELVDPASGTPYYMNEAENITTWDRPALPTEEGQMAEEIRASDEGDEVDAIPLERGDEIAVESVAIGERASVTGPDSGDAQQEDDDQDAPAEKSESKATTDRLAKALGALPEGWVELMDLASGKPYYMNEAENITTWERPLGSGPSSAAEASPLLAAAEDDEKQKSETQENFDEPSMAPLETADEQPQDEVHDSGGGEKVESDALPPGWVKVVDEASGAPYYYNEVENVTTWDRPKVDQSVAVDKTDASTRATTAQSLAAKRCRPAHAIATFGFGGRLCVMIPQVAVSLSGAAAGVAPKNPDNRPSLRKGPVVVHRLRDVVPSGMRLPKMAIEKNVKEASELFGPLIGSSEKTNLAYLEKKANNASKCGDDGSSLLWNVIHVAARSRGRLRSDEGARGGGPEGAVIDLLLKEDAHGKQKFTLPTPAPFVPRKLLSPVKEEKKLDQVEEEENPSDASLKQVQNLLLRGNREEAVNEAINGKHYDLALLVASMCGQYVYQATARRFADEGLLAGSPLHTVAMLFAGQLHPPSDEALDGPRSRSFWSDSMYDLEHTWRPQLASILSNRTHGWDRIVLALGDRLLQLGNVHAAHICYMVCGCPVSDPSHPSSRLVLVGCDHTIPMNEALMTPESVDSFARTEAFEWAKRRGNPKAAIPALQPFKLRYAMLLADCGYLDVAQNYIDTIRRCTGRSGSVFPQEAVAEQGSFMDTLDVFEDRVCVSLGTTPSSRPESEKKGSFWLNVSSVFSKVSKPGSDALKVAAKDSYETGPVDLPSDAPDTFAPPLDSPISGKYPGEEVNMSFVSARSNMLDVTSVSMQGSAAVGLEKTGKQNTQDTSDILENPFSHAPTPISAARAPVTSGEGMPMGSGELDMSRVNEGPDMSQDLPQESQKSTVAPPSTGRPQKEVPTGIQSAPPSYGPGEGKEGRAKELKSPGDSKTKGSAPSSEAPKSGGWLSRLLRRQDPDGAKVADVGEEMKAYYDKEAKRWIFPGDDPAEVAKPLAPPPIIPKGEIKPAETKPPAPENQDPLAALMAPPTRATPTPRSRSAPVARYADPLAAMGATTPRMPPGPGMPPGTRTKASQQVPTPSFTVFQPKPSPKQEEKDASE